MHIHREKKTDLLGKKPSATNDSFRSQHAFDTALTDTNDYQPPDALADAEIGSPLVPQIGHHFSQVQIHATIPETMQTKLAVNQPGDVYEQEADRVAEQVMQMAAPETSSISTKSAGDAMEEKSLLRKEGDVVAQGTLAVPSSVNEMLTSSGQPLDEATRSFMEPRFGHDFSRVRIHSDARAAESAQAAMANAYTSGQHIVFGEGKYDPVTSKGKALLAHELAHVVQQGQSKLLPSSAQLPSATDLHIQKVAIHHMLYRQAAQTPTWQMLSHRAYRISKQVSSPFLPE